LVWKFGGLDAGTRAYNGGLMGGARVGFSGKDLVKGSAQGEAP